MSSRLIALVFVVSFLSFSRAWCASCPYIAEYERQNALYETYLSATSVRGECDKVDQMFEAIVARNRAIDNIVSRCKGYKLTKSGKPLGADVRQNLHAMCQQIRAQLDKSAREKATPAEVQSPASAQSASASPSGGYNPRSNCSTIAGAGMSGGGGAGCETARGNVQPYPSLSSGGRHQVVTRRQWKPNTVAPDVQLEIYTQADTVIDTLDDDQRRPEMVRKLERRLAENRVAMPVKDLACLQPTKPVVGRSIDVPLRWKPEHIKKEAIDGAHLCDGLSGARNDACRKNKYGEAVMWAEPELAGICRTQEAPGFDPAKIAACVKTRFLDAWARPDHIVSVTPTRSWTMPEACKSGASVTVRKQTIRDRLRALLASRTIENDAGDDETSSAPQASAASTDALAPMPPADKDDDEAYCSFMARASVRGELTASDVTALPPGCKSTLAAAEKLKMQSADKPFAMNADDTDREISRLLQQR